MIQQGINREQFPSENSESIKAINKLAEPERRGFALYLLRRYRHERGAFSVDRGRIGAVLYRVSRGLYYHHTSTRLADNARFGFISIQDERKRAGEMAEAIEILAQNQVTVASGRFRYALLTIGTQGTMWLMRFTTIASFFVSRWSRTSSDLPLHKLFVFCP